MKQAQSVFFVFFFLMVCAVSGFSEGVIGENPFIRGVFKIPEKIDIDTIEFSFGMDRGLQLRPGQAFLLEVPEEFRRRYPDYAYIEHRKERFYFQPDQDGLDPNDALIKCDFFNPSTGIWLTWSDQFGPVKRSAVRPPEKPKKNTLYNLRENVGDFSPTMVRIINVGTGSAELARTSIHKFGLVYRHQRQTDPQKTRTFAEFRKINGLLINYQLDSENGLELRQNYSFEFIIPKEFRHRPIYHAILKHRKDPIFAADPTNFDAFDPDAAYILCEAHDRKTGFWHKWADRSSLKKFSEVRTADNPENETLHNCLRTFGQIEPDRFRLTNIGSGNPQKCVAHVHELEILFAPDLQGCTVIEEVFTPETEFNRPDQQRPVPLLGGGPRLGGKFPGALLLGPNFQIRRNQILNLPEKHLFETAASGKNCQVDDQGRLIIDIPENLHIEALEMAIGDLDITSLEYNKDGYFGRSGKAVCEAWIERNGQKRFQLLEQNNLGMAGMVVCGGPVSEYRSLPGDKIIVEVANDNAFLMGYRLLLRPAF